MKGGNITFYFKGDDSDLDKKSSGISSKMGGIAKSVGSAFVTGTAVAGTALTALVGASIKSYADIEQSIGGVETLFKDNADAVIENANRAYKTAGMSANAYMETVTSFSASLLQSLGGDTKKAGDYADRAIIDMSDNANKMGTDMSLIQNAYQGFAKQNYTMLDNLKLGYGGTQTEMQRLIADANKVKEANGEMGNLSISSFADITEAIHIVQTQMGITGTTAKEASETITGSVNTAKSAWANFMSGTGSIDEVIETFTTAGTNISNALVTMAPKIVNGLVGLLNGIMPQIPTLLSTLLPVIIQGTMSLLQGLISAMPQILTLLVNMIPQIVTALAGMLPTIITALINGLVLIIQTLAQMLPELLPVIIDAILGIIPILIDNLPLFIKAGYQLITGLLQGLIQSVPTLLSYIPKIISSLFNYFKQMPKMALDIGGNMVKGLWQGISNVKDWVLDKIKGFGKSILNGIKGIFGIHSPSKEFAFIGRMNAEGLIEGMDGMEKEVQQSFDGMFDLSPQLYGTSNTNMSPNVNVVVNSNYEQDPLGQMVKKVKTFSGGSKNDYNYGYGGA